MSATIQKTFHISGMTCAACANRIEKVLKKEKGIVSIQVNLALEKAHVTYQAEQVSDDTIINRIDHLGYKASREKDEDEHQKEIRKLKWKCVWSSILSLPLFWAMAAHFPMMSSVWVPPLFLNPLFQLGLTIPIQFGIGYSFYQGAWNALKNKTANMDVLVVLSTSTAFFYSHYITFTTIGTSGHEVPLYYETSVVILTFILVGKLLEAITKGRTLDTIKGLYLLQPKSATAIRHDTTIMIPIEQLVVGDILLIKPGERVPTDAEIVEGYSTVDESIFTGESLPVEKQVGHLVIGGTINQNGIFKARVRKVGKDTALAQIIKIVEEAQGSKAPIQRLADELTDVFVPLIVMIAVMTFLAWYYVLTPDSLGPSLEKAMAVLIIACPCALGLATPTSILVGSGRAAVSGVLFKQGKYLEAFEKVDAIFLDKTGTITKGKPELTNLYSKSMPKELFLATVAAAEKGSEHPLAVAVVQYTTRLGIEIPESTHVMAIPGFGIQARVQGKEVLIGSERLMREKFPKWGSFTEQSSQFEASGKTVMHVAIDRQYAGLIALADTAKESSRTAVSYLRQLGKEVVMLTGDNPQTARAIAQQVGIERIFASILPVEKATIIQKWQKKGKTVAMVGDGINDAPALSVANIGVAIGTGTDVAIDAADILVMRGDLLGVAEALLISQATMKNIKQNLFWALAYNTIAIPVTMLGFLAPWIAGASMALSSLSVVCNALRLKRMKIAKWQ